MKSEEFRVGYAHTRLYFYYICVNSSAVIRIIQTSGLKDIFRRRQAEEQLFFCLRFRVLKR